MEKSTRLDFTGQSIYVGLDVHKKSWSVSIQTEQFEHKTFTQPPEVEKLTHYLQRTFPGATYHTVYEAGFSGFWLHDKLREKGIDCMVVNPADVPTKDKDRAGKTDRVDCRKLARGLRNGDGAGPADRSAMADDRRTPALRRGGPWRSRVSIHRAATEVGFEK